MSIDQKPGCYGFTSTYGWSPLCDTCRFNQVCSIKARTMMKDLKNEAHNEVLEQHIIKSGERYHASK